MSQTPDPAQNNLFSAAGTPAGSAPASPPAGGATDIEVVHARVEAMDEAAARARIEWLAPEDDPLS